MTSIRNDVEFERTQAYLNKLAARKAELDRYWKKNPGRVVIALPEEARAVLTTASSGKQRGSDWAKLPADIRIQQTLILNETTWKVIQQNPTAFHPKQFEFMRRFAKAGFKPSFNPENL
jgi:hypothetical protein